MMLLAVGSRELQAPMTYLSDNQRHLVCYPYSVDDLHAMALALNIKACWFHGGQHPHYDIPKRRIDEIRSKTVQVSPRTVLDIIRGVEWTSR